MFEAAELGRTSLKSDYEAEVPQLRSRLLEAQRALRGTRHQVLLVVSGVEGAGKSQVVNRLQEWLDARGIQTHAFWDESDEETERPRYWRFWRKLPPRGSIGIYFGSWYTKPIIDRVFSRSRRPQFEQELQRIAAFERMLADDGARILKFWFHLPKQEQRRRLKEKAKRNRKNFVYSPDAAEFAKRYDRFARVSERALTLTDTPDSPWHVIEATDLRYRDLAVGRIVADALERLVADSRSTLRLKAIAGGGEKVREEPEGTRILAGVDLGQRVDEGVYDRELPRLQEKLGRLAWKARNRQRSTVVLFEGWDAAGKGGAIRRLIAPIDARILQTISVAAPTEEERAQHYLWRFWRHLPRAGQITIYDRSWYGRVLVERVEGFATADEWNRAYGEINDFEEQLVEHGIILLKFWLHIDRKEQLRRFRERQRVAWKQHKITEEDWRNRKKWGAYENAVHDMIAQTSTAAAPWHLVPAVDKRLARLEVARTVVRTMKRALG